MTLMMSVILTGYGYLDVVVARKVKDDAPHRVQSPDFSSFSMSLVLER